MLLLAVDTSSRLGSLAVLRDGKLVTTSPTKDMTREKIVRAMVGRDITQTIYARKPSDNESDGQSGRKSREKVLTVENPDVLTGHEGHHVAVTGKVTGDSIHVDSVSML